MNVSAGECAGGPHPRSSGAPNTRTPPTKADANADGSANCIKHMRGDPERIIADFDGREKFAGRPPGQDGPGPRTDKVLSRNGS